MDRPFNRAIGAAVYVGFGNPDPGPASIAYRNSLPICGPGMFGLADGSTLDLGDDAGVAKTKAVAFFTESPDTWAVPESMWDNFVWFQLRTHAGDVENTTIWRPRMRFIDDTGNEATEILGTAILTLSQKRDAGGWLFGFRYTPRRDGLQPLQYVLHRTAGPTSPSDVTITANQGGGDHQISVASLQDAGEYTFEIIAKNGTVTKVLLEVEITADASGPPAPVSVSIVEY